MVSDDSLRTCGAPNCTEPAEYRCASCDGPRCWEHSTYSTEAGERFCALRPEAFRARRTITYCDPIRNEPLSASGLSQFEVREAWDQREEERERYEREHGERS